MRIFSLLICFLIPVLGKAQEFHGKIFDEDSRQLLPGVLVTNTHSGALWISDSLGNIAFTAYPGDIISFHSIRYRDYELKIFGYSDIIRVGLVRAPVELAEVKVLSPMLRYKQDSIFNHQFFHKELGYANSKTKMNFSSGIGADGLVSELALWASGKKKYYRDFAKEMTMLEDMRYASIRYTTDMVMAQTGLSDSAASIFIVKHPIPDDFVRDASELELKMWVRNQYRASLGDTLSAQIKH